MFRRAESKGHRLAGADLLESLEALMHWEVTTRDVEGVTIIDVTETITNDPRNDLIDAVNEILANGKRQILLNLENVNYIDSMGLGDLVRSYTRVRKQSGKFKFLKPQRNIQDLLTLRIFEIYQDEEEAIKSF